MNACIVFFIIMVDKNATDFVFIAEILHQLSYSTVADVEDHPL